MIEQLVERIKAQQTSLIHGAFFDGGDLTTARTQFETLQMVLNTIKELQNEEGSTNPAGESPKPKGRKGTKTT